MERDRRREWDGGREEVCMEGGKEKSMEGQDREGNGRGERYLVAL